ncbi:Multi antimicrobial extrusion protein [Trema orientale]|uniref:Protein DETOXIFICATION n=1 Tax=Trema orientale TaxID=63057 RepID=A0A2P5FQ75_TREOI|nr:Multi antimicrobial extrusion protein [Trema orientale]
MMIHLRTPFLIQFQNPNPRLISPISTFFDLKTPPPPPPPPPYSFAPNTTTTTLSIPSLRSSSGQRRCFVHCCAAAAAADDDRRNSGEDGGGCTETDSDSGSEGLWGEIKEIVMFSGPATGIWVCAPLMRVIDTAVIGHGSSLELAALGPGTVLCDNLSNVFLFLSIATSNMVATAYAKRDKNEVQHHISILLFVGLTCGSLMLLFTRLFGSWALTAFTGAKNLHIIPVANTYVQIRSLAWPAVLVVWVAQSASLGMKDSWGPLKALAVATVLNAIGDILLCRVLGYGIAGAAWATMVSQVVAGYMMLQNLKKKGYNAFAISIPSPKELLDVLGLAAPMFVTVMAKVSFYILLVYCAASMGTYTMAAHQVMIQTFLTCTVWGEPLSQTAQSFMPEFLYGVKRDLHKARMLLKLLVTMGVVLGLGLGIIGTSIPWLFPNIFTPDPMVIQEMHKVLIPYFFALAVTPTTHSFQGTLLALREVNFLGLSMSGCFILGAILLMFFSSQGFGLPVCWYGLCGFQWARFFLGLQRLLSPNGILFSEDFSRYKVENLKAV